MDQRRHIVHTGIAYRMAHLVSVDVHHAMEAFPDMDNIHGYQTASHYLYNLALSRYIGRGGTTPPLFDPLDAQTLSVQVGPFPDISAKVGQPTPLFAPLDAQDDCRFALLLA